MLFTLWAVEQAGLIEGVPLDVLGIGSGWAIVSLFFVLFMRGRIVPRQTMEDQRSAYESRIEDIEHDRDEWRTAHRISEQARLEEREHNAALVHDIAEPVKGFLEGFRKATRSEVGEP